MGGNLLEEGLCTWFSYCHADMHIHRPSFFLEALENSAAPLRPSISNDFRLDLMPVAQESRSVWGENIRVWATITSQLLQCTTAARLPETWKAFKVFSFSQLVFWHVADGSFAILFRQSRERAEILPDASLRWWVSPVALLSALFPSKIAPLGCYLVYQIALQHWRMNEREVLFSWRRLPHLPFHLCAIIYGEAIEGRTATEKH